MDISADIGNKVLTSRPFDLDTFKNAALTVSTQLTQPEKNCEVRLHCDSGTYLEISRVEIDIDTAIQINVSNKTSDITISSPEKRRLEIGSGNSPTPGFEHLDFDPNLPDLQYCADFRDLSFFEDNIFDEILSIHCIEHIPWREIPATLKEWVRILKPGGNIRIETPSLHFICNAFICDDDSWKTDYDSMWPEEQEHLKLNGMPNKALWANFKLFSSSAGFDKHYACLTGDNLSIYLENAGCRHAEIISESPALSVQATK